jgi:hypothetical protein
MPSFDPGDDYPEASTRPSPVTLHVELKKRTPALRAWVASSPRRSLSPSGKLLAMARIEVVASAPGGNHYLPRAQLRPPQGTEVGRWKVIICEVPEFQWTYTLPEGVAVRTLAIDDDWTLRVGLTADSPIATTLGLAGPELDLTLQREQVQRLPTKLNPRVGPADALAAILVLAGAPSGKLAARAKEAARPPSESKDRKLVLECLGRLRPALIADLRKRVFRYPFPPGTAQLYFEVFHEDLEPLPICGYLWDENDGPVKVVDAKGRRVDAPYLKVLPDRKVVPPHLAKRFTGASVDIAPLLVPWFASCWKAAGGAERFPLNASIQTHDDMKGVRLPSAASRARKRK